MRVARAKELLDYATRFMKKYKRPMNQLCLSDGEDEEGKQEQDR